jgi:ABC-type proline/glycine betaine transport system permease subunit
MKSMKAIFPPTTKRVELNTNEEINNKIKEETLDNISNYAHKSIKQISNRIKELDEEWDIERVLETNAASAIILTTALGFTVNRKWFFATGVVGGFLLQHALQGWCPPVEVFRRLGVRTYSEISYEKEYLKNLL